MNINNIELEQIINPSGFTVSHFVFWFNFLLVSVTA